MHYRVTVQLEKIAQMFKSNIHDPKIVFVGLDPGVNINITCLSGWLCEAVLLFPPSVRQEYTLLAVLLYSAEAAWVEIL